MHRWLLPEAIEDQLPGEAWPIEAVRRRLLDEFRFRGYELVAPPLLEYIDALLTGSGREMDLRTFKIVDQVSGRTMGLRADITPQVARIDAHLLGRPGVTRLCYCGSVVHTLPAGLTATREPLQIGAELYGYAGLEADAEILHLLARSMQLTGLATTRIDLGHIGLFRALAEAAELDREQQEDLFAILQNKDIPSLRQAVADVAEPYRAALLALPDLAGGMEVLTQAEACLPPLPAVTAALADLRRLAGAVADLPLSFDLADLRGYHYYSGVFFAAYCHGHPDAVALGGRYDNLGAPFGRARPAAGFSMDLRQIVRLLPVAAERPAIWAPALADPNLEKAVAALRAQGEVVVVALAGERGIDEFERRLVRHGDTWQVEPE